MNIDYRLLNSEVDYLFSTVLAEFILPVQINYPIKIVKFNARGMAYNCMAR